MSDNKKSLSDNKKALSEEKLSMAENSTQMNEIDKQLAQWQSAYKDATPSVDTDALIKETKSARFKLKLKGAVDLVLGLAVSVWCLTLVLFEPLSTYQFLLFMVLTPIPAAFGAWGYWVRQKQWKIQTLDVQSMLAFKQNQLKQQLHYWKISLYGCLALWCGLLALAVFNVLMFNAFTLWGTQLLINSVVVFVVYHRYKKLAADLPSALAKIDDMK
ncbi:hypothetical protein [Alteromonas macleodii]|uniref:hypothetical protein n=1 Tax=Alteromonas macleodii TaxID=28108 RepID=UPI001E2DDD44|nr:hypothetical protein [Alteromonas macleodii]